jgi:DNA repair protein RadC
MHLQLKVTEYNKGDLIYLIKFIINAMKKLKGNLNTSNENYESKLPEIKLKYKRGNVFKTEIKCANDAVKLLEQFYDQNTVELTESVICIFLSRSNVTIGWMKHSTGGMARSIIDIKLILATALKCGASSIILSHNHPSGSLKPSEDDDNITRKLAEGCRILNLVLLDHIIYTPNGFYSYVDEGLL